MTTMVVEEVDGVIKTPFQMVVMVEVAMDINILHKQSKKLV